MPLSPQLLRVLLVEDNEDDALLVLDTLRRGGYKVDALRVETAPNFRQALAERTWDIVIADFALPTFSGLEALKIYGELKFDMPFILVSGTVGEEVAVESMRAGAHDYLLKDSLTRLVPVIERELRECRIRIESQKSEAALRDNEARFRTLVENSNELILQTTADGLITYASPNYETITGRSPAELIGIHVFAHVHPDDLALLKEKFGRAQTTSLFRCTFKDGSLHWLESSGSTFIAPNGEPHTVIASRDVTARMIAAETTKRLEAQLRQSQKIQAIGTLAGGIAHDFNNILTGILGNVQLAQFELTPGHPAESCLADALKACNRARDLVTQILTFSRRSELALTPTALGSVVEEALKLLRASLPSNIELRKSLDPTTPVVLCDPTQIHQIVMNLGANAAHAIGSVPGSFGVTLELVQLTAEQLRRHPQLRPAHTVCLSLADSGSGMDASTLERIFEPFFTTKPVGEGTGLGLAVVHGIMQALEGAIVVESTVGVGTKFSLYFPGLASAHAKATAPASVVLPEAQGRGQTILLVDDEPGVLQVAERALTLLGYKPASYSSANAALAAVQASPSRFAAIITDLTMPGLGGIDFVRQVAAIRPDLPVVITTGNTRSLDLEAARTAGVRGLLEKPFSLDGLSQALERVLRPPS